MTSFPTRPDLYEFIISDASSEWALVELALHHRGLSDSTSSRAPAFSLLTTILEDEIQSIRTSSGGKTSPRYQLRYSRLWTDVFANISIDDHVALEWLLSLLSPLFIFPRDKIPDLLFDSLAKHINDISLCLNTTGLVFLVEGPGNRCTHLIQMLFSKEWSGPVEKLFHLAYHYDRTAAQFVIQRWSIQSIHAVSSIIDTINTPARLVTYSKDLDRALSLILSVPRDEATLPAHIKASAALLAMTTRFLNTVIPANPDSVPPGTLIVQALCHFQQSGCVQFSHDLDAALREIYSQVPEHPARRLIISLDNELGGTLMLDNTRRMDCRCHIVDMPDWMKKRQESAFQDRYADKAKEDAVVLAAEAAAEVAAIIAKATTQQAQEPRGWPFGPPEVVDMYLAVLRLLSERPIGDPPEPNSQDLTHYIWHIAVECFHSIRGPAVSSIKTPITCRATPSLHPQSRRWATLTLTLHPRQVSECSIVVVKSTAKTCLGIMRRTPLNVMIAIPKAFSTYFQAEVGGFYDGSLHVSIGEYAK